MRHFDCIDVLNNPEKFTIVLKFIADKMIADVFPIEYDEDDYADEYSIAEAVMKDFYETNSIGRSGIYPRASFYTEEFAIMGNDNPEGFPGEYELHIPRQYECYKNHFNIFDCFVGVFFTSDGEIANVKQIDFNKIKLRRWVSCNHDKELVIGDVLQQVIKDSNYSELRIYIEDII